MKGIDILCASQASTAICPNIEQRSLVRHEGSQSRLLEGKGSRALEPASNTLTEQIRRERPRRSTERRDQNGRGIEVSPRGIEEEARRPTHRRSSNSISRFSCSAIDESAIVPYQPSIEPTPRGIEEEARRSTHRLSSNSISRFSCRTIDGLAIVPYQPSPAPSKAVKKCPVVNNDPLPSSSSSSTDATEVVVLRVSLHCQGCARKVRKHISKMEGVTSFSIDLPKQKVTVVGNVTPLEALQSISRVKNAEFWSSSKNNNC